VPTLVSGKEKGMILGGTARNPEDVQALHELGLQFAEISILDPFGFSEQTRVYGELRRKFEFEYVCHGPREGDPNDIHALEKVYFPKVKGILPHMKSLGMPLLTIHLWLDSRFVSKEAIQYKIDLLRRVSRMTSDARITLCLENLSETPDDLELAFQEVSPLQLTLDIGHAQLLTEVNRSHEFLDRFPERIKHVHMHDNRGGRSHLDDVHLPPGEGIIEFDSIFQKLRRTGYSGKVTLELKTEEIRGCLSWVRGIIDGKKDKASEV
jgi:sugar phosphate isomerase/epimerase